MNVYLRRLIAGLGRSDFVKVHAALRSEVWSSAFRST
jgi:hypothetical protein